MIICGRRVTLTRIFALFKNDDDGRGRLGDSGGNAGVRQRAAGHHPRHLDSGADSGNHSAFVHQLSNIDYNQSLPHRPCQQGRAVLEFGSRRAHGFDAATEGARGAYIAGCAGSACTIAGQKYAVPVSGTIAHSYVQLHEAFRSYARVSPDNCILLVDTYDTRIPAFPTRSKWPRRN